MRYGPSECPLFWIGVTLWSGTIVAYVLFYAM